MRMMYYRKILGLPKRGKNYRSKKYLELCAIKHKIIINQRIKQLEKQITFWSTRIEKWKKKIENLQKN